MVSPELAMWTAVVTLAIADSRSKNEYLAFSARRFLSNSHGLSVILIALSIEPDFFRWRILPVLQAEWAAADARADAKERADLATHRPLARLPGPIAHDPH